MGEIDVKKLMTEISPDFTVFTAIERITKLEGNIIDAYWIIHSCLEYPEEDYRQSHEERMRKFMSQFESNE